MTEKQKERVQFDFAPEALQRLDNMKSKTGAATRAETVRKALRVYEWLVDEANEGHTIKTFDEHGEQISIIKASLLL